MRIVHVCAGWEPHNGAANIARMLAAEQKRAGHEVVMRSWASPCELRRADEVWIHCGWLPCLWWAALWSGKGKARWMPEGCYDPVRLAYHGWKKRLVGPIERWCLRRMASAVATCSAEAEWIRAYEPRIRNVEVTDIRRFFDLPKTVGVGKGHPSLNLLYLGRRHPLKGLEPLEAAVSGLDDVELRIVSDAFGAEKEKAWEWCDVLVLPTLSDNFGLVVAEALERGKRVVTTDGAPAWEHQPGVTYVKGFRSGTPETRVRLLREALTGLIRR